MPEITKVLLRVLAPIATATLDVGAANSLAMMPAGLLVGQAVHWRFGRAQRQSPIRIRLKLKLA